MTYVIASWHTSYRGIKHYTTVNYTITSYDSWMNPRTDVITYSAPFSSWGWCYRSTDERRWILECSLISFLRELDCYVAHMKRLWCTIIVKSLLLWAVLGTINKAQKAIAWNEWLGLLLPHPTVKRTSMVTGLDLHSPRFQQAQLWKSYYCSTFLMGSQGLTGWLVWTRSPSSNWKSRDPRSCQSWLRLLSPCALLPTQKESTFFVLWGSPKIHQFFTGWILFELSTPRNCKLPGL